ncbi:chorismate mutase 3, chloroplastic-like [Neltuma alba]|uniref:chorismate mutase 3, chloroplastic-like n=1 Tax=Neltuma alba TaxID=207710 RepID=UPI0010A331FF|nr:chorismate mutase 3, chloroplastic-like [Prosopis alba]
MGLCPIHQGWTSPFFYTRRLEDRVVFTVLERTTYLAHTEVYEDVRPHSQNLRSVLFKTEQIQAAFKGFRVSEEISFFPDALPQPQVISTLNLNDKIFSLYVASILPALQPKKADGDNAASAFFCDISCLKVMSRMDAHEIWKILKSDNDDWYDDWNIRYARMARAIGDSAVERRVLRNIDCFEGSGFFCLRFGSLKNGVVAPYDQPKPKRTVATAAPPGSSMG